MANTKLFFMWNFFEKIGHSPKFEKFADSWKFVADHVAKNNPQFIVTMLHRNLNPKGTFPYVNHAAFTGTEFDGFQQCKPTESWMKIQSETSGPPGARLAYPGGYTEIGTNTGKPLAPWLPKDDKSIFIVTAFKAANEKDTELQQTFEKDWMESSGANFILEKAHKELGISHCGLYKKFTASPGMLYVLRSELTGAGEQSEAAKTFLGQLKEFKYPDYFQRVDTDLFMPDPENIRYPLSGKKTLSDGFAYKP